jgi:hypothetical protein
MTHLWLRTVVDGAPGLRADPPSQYCDEHQLGLRGSRQLADTHDCGLAST